MRKSLKIISVLVSFILLFTSCGKIKPDDVAAKMKTYFEKNNYSECKSYLSSVDSDVKKEASSEGLKLTTQKFDEIYKKYETFNIFDLTLFDNSFIENCSILWQIASEFTPNEEDNSNESLQYLRYFAEISDSMRYKELFRMLKDMYNCGYLYSIQKALYDYDSTGDFSYFETAEKIAAEFNFSDYNPQEYYISDLRSVCENINKYLTLVNNGFVTNDTAVTASAISNIYESADTFLTAYDYVQTVYKALNEAMNTFRINGAFAEHKYEIKFGEGRKYEAGIEFKLSNIFGNVYSPSDSDNEKNDSSSEANPSISKNDAVRIAVNAINKTKAYNSDITVNKSQTVDIQMTAFKTESEITSAVSLVRVRINDALKASNGTAEDSKTFSNGVSDDNILLFDAVPPAGRSASLNLSFVDSYTAVKGSGGYVITFTLPACTSTNDNTAQNLLSMVDGFYFDNSVQNLKHETFYKPTSISLVINNFGCLSKYSYTISGVADCRFTENNEPVASGEFSFTQQYNYRFVY